MVRFKFLSQTKKDVEILTSLDVSTMVYYPRIGTIHLN
jgi:hypothetical protein